MLAAISREDEAHELAAALVARLGRELLVPEPVAVETDWLVRRRRGSAAARAFLADLAAGAHRRVTLTDAIFGRALEIDSRHAGLDLGLVDAAVMAVAEWYDAPILTFDFEHFRAAPRPDGRPWALLVDEAVYARATRRR